MKVLFAGETWFIHSIHQKGFDSFTTGDYGEGTKWLVQALKGSGIAVDHIPNHLASIHFPCTLEKLQAYQAVVLSDIGSNTLLFHPRTLNDSEATPNRLELLKEFVHQGGGLVMCGGWMSYQGIEAKANYRDTPVEELLPVRLMPGDDRVEMPQGFVPKIVGGDHPIFSGVPLDWPPFLFYNRLELKSGATLLAHYLDDPLFAVWDFGRGRSAAFAMDIAPHGTTTEFLEADYFQTLWSQLILWLAHDR